MVLTEDGSGIGARGQGPDLDLGVSEQQPEQLSACITCGACHRNPRSHPHEYAIVDNFMHLGVSGFDARRY
jgi:hypothetical protein